MSNRTPLVVLLALAAAPGCGVSHAVDPIDDLDPLVPIGLLPDAPSVRPVAPITPVASPLATCLEGGGELVEIAAVDNNDQHDHGALLTFGVSPSGILAAAGEDGTLKFWTLDAELIGSVDGSVIAYGAELGASPITDIAFMGEMAVVGDVRGLVQQMGSDGTFSVLGGTSPDVPIDAVAFDEGGPRFAHAQHAPDVMPLVVHGMGASAETIDVDHTLEVVTDLAFATDGSLWVAGANGGTAAIEVRDASDPRIVTRSIALEGAAPIGELALSADGSVAVAVASDFFYVVDASGVRAVPAAEHAASSVATTSDGAFALSIGADGALVANATDDGREVARAAVASPIAVRVDASDRLVVVGGADAILHAFSCEP